MGLMASVAAKLDDSDLSAIANYFAALPANPEQQSTTADNGGDHE
jgi:cytochrome c553